MAMSLKSQVFFLSVSALILGAATAAQADLTISSDATQNMSCSGGVCQPTAADAVLNAGDLENLLASGNVKVSTTGSGVQAGNIDVTAKLGWSKNALTLDSYQSLNVTAPVTIKGKSGLSILTNDGGSGGELAFSGKGHATFKDLSGKLSINGASYTLASSIALLAADIQDDPSGNFALASDYNAKKDGKYGNSPITTDLKGTVDGLGNTISNLTIDIPKVRRDTQWVGLFEGVEGRISNIQLKNISGKAESVAGGRAALVLGTLAGESSGTISRCYTDGSLTSPRESGIGGLVGENDGVITESAANVNVTMQKDYGALGGLAGGNTGQITISFATGSVTFEGDADEDSLGALVGVNHNGTIYNSYATGAVTGGQASGGLVGTNDSDIGESYSIGTVSAGTWVGGLIGNDESQSGSLSDTYWDTTTSGISSPSQGAGNVANDPGITGLTNDQLQSALPAGFDSAVWGENSAINGGLPYLLANPPQ
jgi:hypothetical protein